jgi:hypothetical protein
MHYVILNPNQTYFCGFKPDNTPCFGATLYSRDLVRYDDKLSALAVMGQNLGFTGCRAVPYARDTIGENEMAAAKAASQNLERIYKGVEPKPQRLYNLRKQVKELQEKFAAQGHPACTDGDTRKTGK